MLYVTPGPPSTLIYGLHTYRQGCRHTDRAAVHQSLFFYHSYPVHSHNYVQTIITYELHVILSRVQRFSALVYSMNHNGKLPLFRRNGSFCSIRLKTFWQIAFRSFFVLGRAAATCSSGTVEWLEEESSGTVLRSSREINTVCASIYCRCLHREWSPLWSLWLVSHRLHIVEYN